MTRQVLPLLILALWVLPVSAHATTSSASAFVQQKSDEVLGILRQDVRTNPAAAEQRRQRLEGLIEATIDYDVLAERSLGRHWEGRSAEERQIFVQLLRELVQASYGKRLGDASVDASAWRSEITGERARRRATVVEGRVRGQERSVEVEVHLQQRGEAWMVVDIVTDDVSLQESYAESFDTIIRRDGWDALITRMRERISEMRGA